MKAPANDAPLVLSRWYVMYVLETLVKATYAKDKTALLVKANEGIEMTCWIIRMAHDHKLLALKQFEFSALQFNECGRRVGGWLGSRGGDHRSPSPSSTSHPT